MSEPQTPGPIAPNFPTASQPPHRFVKRCASTRRGCPPRSDMWKPPCRHPHRGADLAFSTRTHLFRLFSFLHLSFRLLFFETIFCGFFFFWKDNFFLIYLIFLSLLSFTFYSFSFLPPYILTSLPVYLLTSSPLYLFASLPLCFFTSLPLTCC